MTSSRAVRPGTAFTALLLIVLITAAWWALALWPVGSVEPEWLLRTRAACFGSAPGGLPDAGGWILLIGQPLGMLGVLYAVWGPALRADLRRLRSNPWWHGALIVGPALALIVVAFTGRRVAVAAGVGAGVPVAPAGHVKSADVDVAALELHDQHGRRRSLAEVGKGPTLLTFAFGHCTTVCPTIVQDLRRARANVARPDVPVVVITLDPWRDTPGRLATIAAQWQLPPTDLVLSGSVAEVERALDVLGVSRRRDEATGDIAHVGMVALLDGGRVRARVEGGWGQAAQLLAALPPLPH
ncbi:MAG: SCO family protein [Gemmatimonadales bacterium]|nr:SCO family protein [Gemmatimonadales bacterium]